MLVFAFLVPLLFPSLSGADVSDIMEAAGEECFESLIPSDSNGGIVAGVVYEGQEKFFVFGNNDFDEETLFEIGSLTKVFTALSLAVMCEEGEVNPKDRLEKYVPEEVNVPSKEGKEITLLHLASHRAGLDRLPINFLRPGYLQNLDNPYKGYTVKMLYEGLDGSRLLSEPGKYVSYSNFGYGILGQVLVNASGRDYESLVKEKICRPLGMTDTMVTLTNEAERKLANGYLKTGGKASNWDMASMVGAGGLKSNVKDMLILLKEVIKPEHKKFREAIELTMEKRYEEGLNQSVGLGWHFQGKEDYEICWHNGGTGGYSSFMGMVRSSELGVVVLTNLGNSGNSYFFQELTMAGFRYLKELQGKVSERKGKESSKASSKKGG